MLTRPVFKNCYAVEIIDTTHALLLSDRESHVLTGSAFTVLASLLGDRKTVPEIIAAAAPRASAAEIYYALDRLETRGVVREADGATPPATAAFWDSLGVDPTAATRALGEAQVSLVVLGEHSGEYVTGALAALGIRVAAEADLTIVLVDDYLRSELATFNDERVRDGKPWLLARTVGSSLWVGPMIRPGTTACWECMAHRMRGHRLAESYVQLRKQYAYPRLTATSSLPSTELAAAGLIATELAKWLAGAEASALEGSILTIDLATLDTRRHTIVRRPQCRVCGDGGSAAQREPVPVTLVSRTKTFSADGGFRATTPELTLARYGHHVSRLTGAVRELSAMAGVDPALAPLYSSGTNVSKKDDTLDSLRSRFRGSSGGKGKTEPQAKAGALCEAIERYSGIFDGSESRIRASYESLGDAAIHPNACMGFSESQYARGGNKHRSGLVPARFDERAEIDWTPLWSLTHGRFRYLPTAYCYFNYPWAGAAPFCFPDSNGCAAGNSIEEAILQGFLELVERDCVAMWWYNRVRRPAVDFASFDEPYFAAIQGYYRSLGRELWAIDITNDFGIPAFAAISGRIGVPSEELILGFGCHLDARLGLLRAVTEVNQFLPIVGENGSSNNPPEDDEVSVWVSTATLANRPFLVPAPGASRTAADYHYERRDDLKDEVEACVAVAAARGLETLALDQTRPDIGLPVVRVVVPGLRHFWARFAPGRLYDVPVKLGWLDTRTAEQDLNPIAVFF